MNITNNLWILAPTIGILILIYLSWPIFKKLKYRHQAFKRAKEIRELYLEFCTMDSLSEEVRDVVDRQQAQFEILVEWMKTSPYNSDWKEKFRGVDEIYKGLYGIVKNINLK